MHNLTDIQLIRHIQTTQDEHACEELIRRYYGVLRQLVKYKVPARTDIDDIVQEVMIKVITKIDQLRDPSKFKPWIYRIVRSQIQDYFRTAYPQIENTIANEEHTLLDTHLVTESSEDAILHKLEMSDIYDIILGFPVENVKPFLLHHLDNLSYAEIAAVTQENHQQCAAGLPGPNRVWAGKCSTAQSPRKSGRGLQPNSARSPPTVPM